MGSNVCDRKEDFQDNTKQFSDLAGAAETQSSALSIRQWPILGIFVLFFFLRLQSLHFT